MPAQQTASLAKMLGLRAGNRHPRQLAPLINRIKRRPERGRVGESADRDGDQLRLSLRGIGQPAAAFGAEAEGRVLPAVAGAGIIAQIAAERDAIDRKPRLRGERAARALLSIEAMAYRDTRRLALAHRPCLAAPARRDPRHSAAAASMIGTILSAVRLAPPISPPSTSGVERIAVAFAPVIDPP